MAKNSREYWRDREEAQRQHDITDEAEYRREIERIYRRMMSEMQKELSDFYVKYATKNGITLSEAKRRVKRLDMQAYAEKAKEYVKNRDFSAQANAEMELYNLTMKANRLEMLKAELGMHVVGGYDEIQKYFEDKLSDRTVEEFRRQGGILADTIQNNSELIDSIVNASFHHATFSERIWGQYAGFKSVLDREITHGLIQGIGSEQLARNIRKTCADVSARDALRLMVTEMARVRTDAAKLSMEKNGNTEYEFMALGRNPCPVCKGLNGKIFKVKDLMPGENAPPMHPWCHCSTAPHWDEKTYQEWLDSGAAKAGIPFEEFSQKGLQNAALLYRAKNTRNEEELRFISNSEVIDLEDHEDLIRHFQMLHRVQIEGFTEADLFKSKAVLAGCDDFLNRFSGCRIKKIVYDPVEKHPGVYDRLTGTVRIGPDGLGSYGTGLHECAHSLDVGRSLPGKNDFSEGIVASAIKNLRLKRNSRQFINMAYQIVQDSDIINSDPKEFYAYSMETAMGGVENMLAAEILRLTEMEVN